MGQEREQGGGERGPVLCRRNNGENKKKTGPHPFYRQWNEALNVDFVASSRWEERNIGRS